MGQITSVEKILYMGCLQLDLHTRYQGLGVVLLSYMWAEKQLYNITLNPNPSKYAHRESGQAVNTFIGTMQGDEWSLMF